MPFKALLYVTRKPGTTPAEFKTHYETVHVPLIKELAGDLFPLSHRRLYLARPSPGEDGSYPVAAVLGDQEDFTYDCITELTFSDEKAMQVFFAKRMEPSTKEVVEEDENKFLQADKLKLVVLGDVQETTA
ncbi:EthD domain-containing protein [Aspergillus stella-maris]|uniref:EthD domain-containing protein n=1 Tax=Aspergillus stella-maris TaxID=1810926 RepID=UPI003CCC9C54